MTVLEKKKYKLIRAIMNDMDRKRVSEIERLYEAEPCMFSSEELRTSVTQRTNDYYAGKMELIPHDEIKRKII